MTTRCFGARQTLRHVLAYLLTIPDDEFDREDGVATRGQQALPEHGIELATLENAHFYEPTREQVMRHILRYASARLSPRTLSFVDLGCGKGRALLLAAELPFLEVIWR